jgi:hypothetical protein
MMTSCRHIVVAVLLSTNVKSFAAAPNSCISVVKAWHKAVDCQETEQVAFLTWPDGYRESEKSNRTKWSDVSMNGPCPKYRTESRRVQVSAQSGVQQKVNLEAVTRRVNLDGKPVEGYSITREAYICERRNGQWRILSQTVMQRADSANSSKKKRTQ